MGAGQEPFAGREVAGYRLLHLLGAGGASEVYLAQRLDNPAALVAIKLLRPFPGIDPVATAALEARFLREAEAATRLQHPNILSPLAYGRDNGVDYMVLPFMPGGTLVARINTFTRGMPLPVASDYLIQIAAALDYAHEHGVIHRDVKPANVLLDAGDRALLADFGIARVFEASGQGPVTTLTIEGQMLGTPAYIAPEQVEGPRVSRQADIYALGVTLYQMVTGALPFEADTPVALAMRRLQREPPPPRRDRAELPAPAQAAILRALALRPEDRYPTAGALARAFDAGVRGQWAPEELTLPDGGAAPSSDARRHSSASTVAATPTSAPVHSPALAGGSHGPHGPRASQSVGASWREQDAPTEPDRISGRRAGRGAPALWMLLGVALAIVAISAGAIFNGWTPTGWALGRNGAGLFGLTAASTATRTPAATFTATISPAIAACLATTGFSGATSPASGGHDFADVAFPTDAVSKVYQAFTDGAYHFTLLDVCAPDSTPSSARSFYALAMPANGWSPSATFPYAGNPTRACGDTYCWVKGSAPQRFVSLERVAASGARVVYQLRLGLLP